MSTTTSDQTTGSTDAANTTPSTYIVLKLEDGGEWVYGEDSRVQAPSAEAAIRAYLKDSLIYGAATFVAIPARSWKPVKVQAVQTTVLKLEDAGS